ncbi:LOW QUALITY PROTEIN: hypothetical protein M8C21_006204, partial [Ambrosia artemisiifolia]
TKNCSCLAYAYENTTYGDTIVCLNWFRELVDSAFTTSSTAHDLFVRVHSLEVTADDNQEHTSIRTGKHLIAVVVAGAVVSIGFLLISVFGYLQRRKRLIRKERIKNELLGFDSISTASGDAHNNAELVPFSLKSVLAATGSFSVRNKLGEGGFGSVYKGSLPGNRQVAVKRLSTKSSQGRDEFMNELKLIAKLQHTNLVRLLGCCVEDDEKILMYEYMPNRSLDKFIFDAALFDNGNLVLRHGGQEVWQSFDHPTDTVVSGMKFSSNRKTGQKMLLTSWVNDEDPRPGIFSLGIDPIRYQVYTWKEDKPYWRSNVYATPFSYASGFVKYGQRFSGYFSFVIEDDEVYIVYSASLNSLSTRFTLAPNGQIQLTVWVKSEWLILFMSPLVTCDHYSYCGPFTTCKVDESVPCKCLTGFDPKLPNEWSSGNWTGGCVRNKLLRCDKGDKFIKFEGMKLPDYAVNKGNKSVIDCETECTKNCSCLAYAYENTTYGDATVCLNWFRELVDASVTKTSPPHDLFVRVHSSELAADDRQEHTSIRTRKHLIAVVVAGAIVSIGLLLIGVFGYLQRRKRLTRKEIIKNELHGLDSMSAASGDAHNNAELVSFSLKSVLAATGSFSVENKLGEGGFGSVYKGSLPGNRQVAVKRLSTKSSQGRDEFMNELKLIAKLQHTNLVRLLGCCVEDDEKILMYEYMPNRSLDKFIFDPTESVHLDGSMRFKIIEGIAQGLLYLHKYSRLRVIHRDLKASNVLLDETMTPKISDFGLARIFGMNQIEDKTNRVVGTYGYMAPEYALHGRFSEKSDLWGLIARDCDW